MNSAIEKIGGVLLVVGIGHDFLKYEKNMLPMSRLPRSAKKIVL